MPSLRRTGTLAALAATPLALAYRFALVYRVRAGHPRRHPPTVTPADLGMPYESITVPSAGIDLAGWFIPARGGRPGPGVVLIHGWESARDRTLPNAQFLHAAGFHCLTIDVRGHGANPPDPLPISAGEFGADALAAFRALVARAEVSSGAILGHSMGGIGAILAASHDPRVAALVAVSTPADPYRLTRQTFRLARLPFPDPVAYPLALLTTRVYLRPRRHSVGSISASSALRRYAGPVLLAHGDDDAVVPPSHLDRLANAANAGDAAGRRAEMLRVRGGQHSWLYEFPEFRRAVATFLARELGGPLDPSEAGVLAEAVPVTRLPDAEQRFAAVAEEPGGVRSLVGIVRAPVDRRGDGDGRGDQARPAGSG